MLVLKFKCLPNVLGGLAEMAFLSILIINEFCQSVNICEQNIVLEHVMIEIVTHNFRGCAS